MNATDAKQTIPVNATSAVCPIGEATGKQNINDAKIPVLSCEGACIRGEIARLAANLVSRRASYARGCHGELITVPDSAISRWIKTSAKVVLIDGCFLRCHGRIIDNLIDADKLVQFDALSHYNRYTDIFDYEEVPEEERRDVAQSVADWVVESLANEASGKDAAAVRSQNPCGACCG